MTLMELRREEEVIKERLHSSMVLREAASNKIVAVSKEFEEIMNHALTNGSREKVRRAFCTIDEE